MADLFGARVALDARPEKIGHKIREASLGKVPYMVLLGPKDVESGTLAVRVRDAKAKDGSRQMNGVTADALLKRLKEEIDQKMTRPSEEQA